MDFHSMKRKELQALCKRHKIPANVSNQEMATKLTELLKEKENPLIRKGQDENVIETESADLAVNRKVKKVRFSPEDELIEFTRSPVMKMRSSRNSGLSRNASLSVVNVDSSEMEKQILGRLGRSTRSRGLKAMEAKENVKKRGRNFAKCDKNTNAAAIELFDNGKLKEGIVDSSGGVMLLREEMLEVGDKNASKRTKKRAKNDDKKVEKASENVANEKPTKGFVDHSGRVTRSKLEKLTEVHEKVEKRGKEVARRVGNVAVVSSEIEENRVGGTGPFVNRGDVGEGKLTMDSGERVKCNGKGKVLENKNIAGECHATEPQIILRRSKRNAKMVTDYVILKDTKKHENNENIGLRKTSKLLALNNSGVNAEAGNEVNLGKQSILKTEEAIKVEPRRSNRRKNVVISDELKAETGNEVNLSKRSVLKTEEAIKVEPRRSNRRTNVIVSDELKAETENRDALRSSVQELGITGEVSKHEKNDGQPTAVMIRLRRKTLNVELVSADEEIDTDSAVENLEEETKNRHILKSVPQLEIAGGSSQKDKNIIQPSGMMKRSTRKTLNLTVVHDNEKIYTDAAVENLEVEKNKNEPCQGAECPAVKKDIRRSRRIASKCKSPGVPVVIGGDSVIHQKNKVMKRKRAAISGGDIIKSKHDPVSFAETMKEGSSQKAVPGAATGNVAHSTKRTSRLNDFKLFDASSHNGLESGDQFPTIAKPSASEGLGSTSNLGFSTDTSPKNTSDVGLTSTKNTHRKKPDNSLADGAGISNMKLMSEKEMDNFDTNAASRIKELKADLTDSEDQTSVNNIRVVENGSSPLKEINVHELIEQNTTDTHKNENDPEAHVLSQTEDLCNNEIDNQVLTEEINEGFDETGSSTDGLLIGDQIDNNADVEVAEAEADKFLQPSPFMVDNVDGTRKDNQVVQEDLNISKNKGFHEIVASPDNLLFGDQTDAKTDMEIEEVEADKFLQPNTTVVDRDGESIGTSAQKILGIDETKLNNQVTPDGPNVPGNVVLDETVSSAGSPLLGDQADIKPHLDLAEAEAEKCLQPSPVVVEQAGGKNLVSDGIRQDSQVLQEGSNVPGTEADLEGVEAEEGLCLQPNPGGVEYAGDVQGVSDQYNLDSDEMKSPDEMKKDSQVLPEGSSVSGNEDFAETRSYAERSSPCDQTDIKTDPEVAEAEGDKCQQRTPRVVDHVSQVNPISVQENLDAGETRQANDITSSFSYHCVDGNHMEASNDILENYNNNTSPKAGEFGALESSETHVDNSHSKCTLELVVPSSGMLKMLEVGNLAEGNGIFDNVVSSELAETNEDGNSNIQKGGKYCELRVPDLSNGERTARIGQQDRVVFSGEYSVMTSEEQGKYQHPLSVAPIINNTEINLMNGHETKHITKRKETYDSLNLESGKSVEGGSSEGHKSKCEEDGAFSVSYLFDSEEMFHSSPTVAPTTMRDFASDLEADLLAEGTEAYTCCNKQSELIGSDGSGCFKSHKSSKDENWEMNISHLFDGEKSARITPHERGLISSGYFINDSKGQVMFPDFASVSTSSANYNELKFSADSSNLQEISLSKPNSVSESQADKPKSPLTEPAAAGETTKIQEAWSNGRETAGHTMCFLEANAERNASQPVEGSSTDEDAIDARWGKEREDFGGPCIKDVEVATDCAISKIGVESLNDMKSQNTEETEQHLSENLLASVGEDPSDSDSIQSWTGIELHNLATNLDTDTTFGLNDTSYQGTEVANHNLTMSTNKSISSNRGSLTEKEEKEIEGERSECEEITNENLVLPSTPNEVSHIGFNVEREELDGTVMSVMEEGIGYELEKSYCLRDPLSGDGEDVSHDRLNELDSIRCESSDEQLTENTGDCQKETNLITESDKDEDVIPLGLSCLFNEAPDNENGLAGKNSVNLSGSPKNSDKLGACQEILTAIDLSKNLSCEAEFESCISDLQKSNIIEKSHHLTTCSENVSIFEEASIETFRCPMDAEIAGTSPSHFPKASPDFDAVPERGDSIRDDHDPYGTNIQDEKDCNLISSQGEQEYGDIEKSLEGTPEQENFVEEVEKSSTAKIDQFSISQIHFEEKLEDFSNHVHTISDAPSSVCNEILKESDVADTIKEYIDSESSLPMIFKTSDPSLPINEVDVLEGKSKKLDESTPNIDSLESPACVDSLVEGIDVKLDPQKQIETDDGQRLSSSSEGSFSTVKKNARAILIHGTPGKIAAMADMKENTPTSKRSNAAGDLTRVRPANRRALKDVHWK